VVTILDYLRAWQWLPSREGKTMFASGSELRRWFDRGSVEVNGVKAMASDPWPFDDQSVVIHPNGKHRTTLQ
jgi:hypothetical protein